MPGEGVLALLLLAGLWLLARDLPLPGREADAAAAGGWVRLVDAQGRGRFCPMRDGEPLGAFLARALPPGQAPAHLEGARRPIRSGLEIRMEPVGPVRGSGWGCRLAPLPEGVRYLLGLPMDLNRAGAEELALLPGIGEALAARIVEARERAGRQRFSRWEELEGVPGLGRKRLQNIERHVTLGP